MDGHFSQGSEEPRPSCDGCDNTRGFIRPVGGQRSRRPLPLFCLAPHRVYHAPVITRRAVGSYPAFSPLPPVASSYEDFDRRRSVLCDTFRRRGLSPPPPVYSTRYAAVWCPDFPPGFPPAVVHRHGRVIGRRGEKVKSKKWEGAEKLKGET